MSFIQLVHQRRTPLELAARSAIHESMLYAWKNAKLKPQEPDFVASLVFNGSKTLASTWPKIVKPYKVAITGIYCHQTPQVTFAGSHKGSCELGDLIWCHIHTDQNGRTMRNAILYQAKVSSEQPYRIHPNDDQYALYFLWPEFSYVSPSCFRNKTRKLAPSAPRRGAQYLLIDDRSPNHPLSGLKGIRGTYPIGSCLAFAPLVDHAPIEIELVNSLMFLAGDPFDDRDKVQSNNDIGWSRIVWDLLEATAQKAFRRINAGFPAGPRQVGAPPSAYDGLLYFDSQELPYSPTIAALLPDDGQRIFHKQDNRRHNNKNLDWYDEEGGGTSVLLVETFESLD